MPDPTPEQKAQEIIDSYSPSRKHLLSLYRRPTVYTLVKERFKDISDEEVNNITNKLWDLLHP